MNFFERVFLEGFGLFPNVQPLGASRFMPEMRQRSEDTPLASSDVGWNAMYRAEGEPPQRVADLEHRAVLRRRPASGAQRPPARVGQQQAAPEASPTAQPVPRAHMGSDYSAVNAKTSDNARETFAQRGSDDDAYFADRSEVSSAFSASPRHAQTPGELNSVVAANTSENAHESSAQSRSHVEGATADMASSSPASHAPLIRAETPVTAAQVGRSPALQASPARADVSPNSGLSMPATQPGNDDEAPVADICESSAGFHAPLIRAETPVGLNSVVAAATSENAHATSAQSGSHVEGATADMVSSSPASHAPLIRAETPVGLNSVVAAATSENAHATSAQSGSHVDVSSADMPPSSPAFHAPPIHAETPVTAAQSQLHTQPSDALSTTDAQRVGRVEAAVHTGTPSTANQAQGSLTAERLSHVADIATAHAQGSDVASAGSAHTGNHIEEPRHGETLSNSAQVARAQTGDDSSVVDAHSSGKSYATSAQSGSRVELPVHAEASPIAAQATPRTQSGNDYSAVDAKTSDNRREKTLQARNHVEAPSADGAAGSNASQALPVGALPSPAAQSVPRTQSGGDYSALDSKTSDNARSTLVLSGNHVEAQSADRAVGSHALPVSAVEAQPSPIAAQATPRTQSGRDHSAVDAHTSDGTREKSPQAPSHVEAPSADRAVGSHAPQVSPVGALPLPTAQSVPRRQSGRDHSAVDPRTSDSAREKSKHAGSHVEVPSADGAAGSRTLPVSPVGAQPSPTAQSVPRAQSGSDSSVVDAHTSDSTREKSPQARYHVEAPSAGRAVGSRASQVSPVGALPTPTVARSVQHTHPSEAHTAVHASARPAELQTRAARATVPTQAALKYHIHVSARQAASTGFAPRSSPAANRRYRSSVAPPPSAESPKIRAALPALRPKVSRPVSLPPLRVSIGRVRFADAPAPPPQRIFKRPSPNYGLATYLSGRGGGS